MPVGSWGGAAELHGVSQDRGADVSLTSVELERGERGGVPPSLGSEATPRTFLIGWTFSPLPSKLRPSRIPVETSPSSSPHTRFPPGQPRRWPPGALSPATGRGMGPETPAAQRAFMESPAAFYRVLRQVLDAVGPWRVFFGTDLSGCPVPDRVPGPGRLGVPSSRPRREATGRGRGHDHPRDLGHLGDRNSCLPRRRKGRHSPSNSQQTSGTHRTDEGETL
jgi:hypothetical protein